MSKNWLKLLEFVRALPATENAKNIDNPNLTFAEQAIDSLDLASLFLAVEDKFHIQLLDDPALRPKTFSDILKIMDNKKP